MSMDNNKVLIDCYYYTFYISKEELLKYNKPGKVYNYYDLYNFSSISDFSSISSVSSISSYTINIIRNI